MSGFLAVRSERGPHGGYRLNRQVMPFMFGLILGEYCVGAFWSALSVVSAIHNHNYIHTYDIRQSQEDGVTVPIWYAPRLTKLHLSTADIDAGLAEVIAAGEPKEASELERRKSRWAQLAAAARED